MRKKKKNKRGYRGKVKITWEIGERKKELVKDNNR